MKGEEIRRGDRKGEPRSGRARMITGGNSSLTYTGSRKKESSSDKSKIFERDQGKGDTTFLQKDQLEWLGTSYDRTLPNDCASEKERKILPDTLQWANWWLCMQKESSHYSSLLDRGLRRRKASIVSRETQIWEPASG